ENSEFGKVFIEMSACEGSCVNGPCIRDHAERRLKGAMRVDTFAGSGETPYQVENKPEISATYAFDGGHKVKFGSDAIRDMLYKMGKTSPEKELNCGSCGYPTCRDKAIAILEGKAKIEMCLPFLKEKAESFSDTIIHNTPTAIIVMDEDLIVQQINPSAIKMFKLKDAGDILHEHVVRILNPSDYQMIVNAALHIQNRKHFLSDYGLYVDETILYDRQYHVVITLIRDETEHEQLRLQGAELKQQTMEITDKVIEKQMRIVQEIASLLGETTAETQIALTKLKDAMAHE
ncbi:MAG: (Fe-S)-binding protein, partial [Clostridia bacterium]|nr:(Fe-S)-binding protein [Clostridia bacterium]